MVGGNTYHATLCCDMLKDADATERRRHAIHDAHEESTLATFCLSLFVD